MFKIRRRLAVWAGITIGLPLLAKGLHAAAEVIETNRGPSTASRRLRQAGRGAQLLHGRLGPPRRSRLRALPAARPASAPGSAPDRPQRRPRQSF